MTWDEVGCRRCGKGGGWKILTDGQGNFRAVHSCGHISEFNIVRKPDPQAIPLHLVI